MNPDSVETTLSFNKAVDESVCGRRLKVCKKQHEKGNGSSDDRDRIVPATEQTMMMVMNRK